MLTLPQASRHDLESTNAALTALRTAHLALRRANLQAALPDVERAINLTKGAQQHAQRCVDQWCKDSF